MDFLKSITGPSELEQYVNRLDEKIEEEDIEVEIRTLHRRDRRYPAGVSWYDIEVSVPGLTTSSGWETYKEQISSLGMTKFLSDEELQNKVEKRVEEIEYLLARRGYRALSGPPGLEQYVDRLDEKIEEEDIEVDELEIQALYRRNPITRRTGWYDIEVSVPGLETYLKEPVSAQEVGERVKEIEYLLAQRGYKIRTEFRDPCRP